jgi:hypothetical protein
MTSNSNDNTAATNAGTTPDTGQGGSDSTSDTNNAVPGGNLPTEPMEAFSIRAIDKPSTDPQHDDLMLRDLHSSDGSGDVRKPIGRWMPLDLSKDILHAVGGSFLGRHHD